MLNAVRLELLSFTETALLFSELVQETRSP